MTKRRVGRNSEAYCAVFTTKLIGAIRFAIAPYGARGMQCHCTRVPSHEAEVIFRKSYFACAPALHHREVFGCC